MAGMNNFFIFCTVPERLATFTKTEQKKDIETLQNNRQVLLFCEVF